MSIADKLTTIAKNQEKVYKSGLLTGASGGVANGEIISLTDVAPGAYDIDVKLSSKNLFNNDTSLLKAVTYTGSGGTQSTRIAYEPLELPTGTYTFTLTDLDTSLEKYIYGMICDKDTKFIRSCNLLQNTTKYTPLTITVNEGERVLIYNAHADLNMANRAKEFNAVQIQLEKGTKATAYTPYVEDVSKATLKAQGNNLLPLKFIYELPYEKNGITFADNGDGGIRVSGTASADAALSYSNVTLMPNVTYRLVHIGGATNLNTNISYFDESGVKRLYSTKSGAFTWLSDYEYRFTQLFVNKGTTLDTVVYPMLVLSTADRTKFEPYIEPTSYKPNADGTVEDIEMIYPNMTLMSSIQGILMDCEYRMDAKESYVKGGLSQCPKKTISGEELYLTDISPIEHNLGVKVSSKNLLNNILKSGSTNGITYTVNEDKSVVVNGTATSACYIKIGEIEFDVGTYIMSGCPSGGNNSTYNIYTSMNNNYYYDVGSGKAFTVSEKTNLRSIYIFVGKNVVINNLIFKPMLEKGTKATAYTPFVEDVSTTTLKAQGKNLIPYPYAYTTKTVNGITFTDNGDGSITANGTATADVYHNVMGVNIPVSLPVGVYTLSGSPAGGGWSSYLIYIANMTTRVNLGSDIGNGCAINIDLTNDGNNSVMIFIKSGITVDNLVFKPMIAVGTNTEYEPYKEPANYKPMADGAVEGVVNKYCNFSTNTEGVLIEVEYHQSSVEAGKQLEHDKFWDVFQINGTRKTFQSTFTGANFSFDNFYPKYDIICEGNCASMFYNWRTARTDPPYGSLKQRLEECGVKLDTSGATVLTSAFAYSTFTELPTIDLTGLTGAPTALFAYNYEKFETIEKIIVNENTPLATNMFASCNGLKNVTFEGVIGGSLDLQWTKVLSKESIESIIGCLSGTVTGKTLTLSQTAVNTAFTTDEWNTLIADKTNWTISLV